MREHDLINKRIARIHLSQITHSQNAYVFKREVTRPASKIPPYRAGFFMVGAGRNFAADALDIGQTRRLVAPSGAERIRKAPHFSGAFDCFWGSGFICYLKETPASEATSDMVRRFAMM